MQVTLNIARSEDEAERQARGEDVTVIKEEKIELETFDRRCRVRRGSARPPEGEEEQPEVPAEAD